MGIARLSNGLELLEIKCKYILESDILRTELHQQSSFAPSFAPCRGHGPWELELGIPWVSSFPCSEQSSVLVVVVKLSENTENP